MTAETIKVLYIGGYGRSGSTLLAQLLGQVEGFHSVGEMWNIWQQCFAENQLCGCGKPFRECEFWRAVVDEAFGGFDRLDLNEINTLAKMMRSHEYLLLLSYPKLRSTTQQRHIERYLTLLRCLYKAIHLVSGSRVIVDSSKGPRYAMLLKEIAEIDLRVIHLVRDSRGVAYSWQKRRVKPEVYWKTEYMDQVSPVNAAMLWNITNLFMETFRKDDQSYLFVRYEDLVASPSVWLDKMIQLAGEENSYDSPVDNDGVTKLKVEHTAGGNPSRYRQGPTVLRNDDEWQQKMLDSQKRLVTTMTRPLLRRYGYAVPYQVEAHPNPSVNPSVDNHPALGENGRPV